MKKLKPFRETKKHIRLHCIIFLDTKKEGVVFPLPKKIVDSFGIKEMDIAVFEVEKNCLIVKFVKKNLWSFIEKGGIKNETRRSTKQTKKRKGNIISLR